MATLRLGELLIQQGLITPSQLDQALTAQHVFGGRLGTNLVEQGFVSEEDLARVLSQQLGIRVVRPHEIANVDRRVLELITPDLARKYQVVPFAAESGRISLGIADPGNLQKVDEIQFALGRKVDFAICPEVLLAWALEKHYRIERTRRYIRVAGLSDAELHLRAEDRPGPQAARKAPAAALAPGLGRLPPRDEMLRRIVEAPTKKDLIAATVDLLALFSGQMAFFVVKGDDLLAWAARGTPVGEDALHGVALPIASSAVARAALEGCRHELVARLGDSELEGVLERLFVATDLPAFVLPLVVNRKGFGLCVMTQLPADFSASEPLLAELMKRVACKLQIFFLSEYLSAPL